MKRSSQIMPKRFLTFITSSMTSQGGLKVSIYIHVYERFAPRTSRKDNVSSIYVNIIIVFLSYTCQKTISMNNTFRDCRSKVYITGLLSYLGTYTATTLSILGLSRWNKNWSVRNSYSYVPTATKIRFHVATWKFSDFCSRHTVGVAGDDIMLHILVFDLRLNKRLSEQWWGWWFETLDRAHCDVSDMNYLGQQ